MADGIEVGVVSVGVEFEVGGRALAELSRQASDAGRKMGRETAQAHLQAAEQAYRQQAGRIRQAVAEGLLSPDEAGQAGQRAAEAWAREAGRAIDAAVQSGAFTAEGALEVRTDVDARIREQAEQIGREAGEAQASAHADSYRQTIEAEPADGADALTAGAQEAGEQAGATSAEALLRAAEERLSREQARIRDAQEQGFLSPEDAAAAGEAAVQAWGAEIERAVQADESRIPVELELDRASVERLHDQVEIAGREAQATVGIDAQATVGIGVELDQDSADRVKDEIEETASGAVAEVEAQLDPESAERVRGEIEDLADTEVEVSISVPEGLEDQLAQAEVEIQTAVDPEALARTLGELEQAAADAEIDADVNFELDAESRRKLRADAVATGQEIGPALARAMAQAEKEERDRLLNHPEFGPRGRVARENQIARDAYLEQFREQAKLFGQQGRESAIAQVEGFQRAYMSRLAEIKELQARGMITRAEAQQLGREAGQAYNDGVLQVIESAGDRGLFRGREGGDLFRQIAGSLKSVDEAGRLADIGVSRLNLTLASLLRQVLGTHPAVGQLVNAIGSFALGGIIMTGVLAGLAALAFAWQRITREAREAKKEQEEAADRLEAIFQRRTLGATGQLERDLETRRKEREALEEEMHRARAAVERLQAMGREERAAQTEVVGVSFERQMQAAERDLRELNERHREILSREREGQAELTELRERAASTEASQAASALASLISSNRATEAERRRALDMIRQANEEAAALGEEDIEKRAALVNRARQLEAAFEAAARPSRDAREAERERERAAQRLQAMEADMEMRLARLLGGATDALLLELDRLEQEAREAAAKAGEAVSEEFLAGLATLRDSAELQRALDGFRERLDEAVRAGTTAVDFSVPFDQLVELDVPEIDFEATEQALAAVIADLQAANDELEAGSALQEEFNRLLQRAVELRERNVESARREREATERRNKQEEERQKREEERARQERLRDLREQARTLEENARAALQLAEAFGAVDSEAARSLQSVVQLGAAIFRIAGGDLSAIPSAIGAAASLVTSLGSGREDAERRRVIKDNTAALERLREGVARLGSALLGERASDIVALRGIPARAQEIAVERFMARARQEWESLGVDPLDPHQSFEAFVAQRISAVVATGRDFEEALREVGLTMEDAERIARQLGIELDGTRQAWEDFATALRERIIAQVFDDPSGQRTLIGQQAQLFGLSDEERLRLEREQFLRFANLAPETEARVRGADLGTEEGREEFRAILREIFQRWLDDPDAMLEELGELSPQAFADWILGMDRLAESADAAADALSDVGDINVPAGFKRELRRAESMDFDPREPEIFDTGTPGVQPPPPGFGTARDPVPAAVAGFPDAVEASAAQFAAMVEDAGHRFIEAILEDLGAPELPRPVLPGLPPSVTQQIQQGGPVVNQETVIHLHPGAIQVPGSGDPRAVAREVFEEFQRQARRTNYINTGRTRAPFRPV